MKKAPMYGEDTRIHGERQKSAFQGLGNASASPGHENAKWKLKKVIEANINK